MQEDVRRLEPGFWFGDTVEIARRVLGKIIVCSMGGEVVSGRIVESEAYLSSDEASHSFRGMTRRTAPMFGSPGTAYIYFTYGNHWCLNFVTAPEGVGEAVLVRALEPLEGLETMARRRGRADARDFASGPGKVCQALALDGALNGHDLSEAPLKVVDDGWQPGELAERTRIGISRSVDKLWRFYPLRSAMWVSRK